MNFHEKMKLLRNELELTQEQASAKMGIGIASIKNYEKDRLPDSQKLKIIKEFYKVPYEFLLNDECNTREEENLKIGEKLGLSDNSISVLKELSLKGDNKTLEYLLDFIYHKNLLEKIKELSEINYIIDTVFNDVCPKIEKLIKIKKYSNITEEQIDAIEFLCKYNADVRDIRKFKEQEYLRYLSNNKKYKDFIELLTYIIPTINYKAKVNDKELQYFNNYKELKEIFTNYKTYLITNIVVDMNNSIMINLKAKK